MMIAKIGPEEFNTNAQQAPLFSCETCEKPLYDCPRAGFHGPWEYDKAPKDVQEKAVEKWQEDFHTRQDTDWSEYTIEDAEQIAEILGITIDSRPSRSNEPCIYWSGFSSQGGGACFEGSYAYKKGAAKEIRQHAPQDEELHRIANRLQQLQAKAFYQLTATSKHTGHYSHSHSTTIDVYRIHPRTQDDLDASDYEEPLAQLLRDFMDWIYKRLEEEYNYQGSEEAAKEILLGYDVTEEGEIC